ncbi:hypothetical protein EIN_470080 [Entamoeba invadens IP1]|uniref:Uncharacterized protein n=1 Tax=Entamoeba invadens IP1 TaxID=370355 RepID=A0A0A1TUN6_ENTIV|nr:hypothetical protein EIN_470080 [Entamoeba invadens IP1]ELP83774.1 hypothetical protein EIN_470080 [Entamoeba invadens IP1]|eukprot:XP_004183120.1 hypothetical protein EIN_470080 [Entamoeba invadens IP1]
MPCVEGMVWMVCTFCFIAPMIVLGVVLLGLGIATLPSSYVVKKEYDKYPNTFKELNFVYKVGVSFGYISIIICVLYLVFWGFMLFPGGGVVSVWYTIIPIIGAVVFIVIGSLVIHNDKNISIYTKDDGMNTYYEDELAQYEINEKCCFSENYILTRTCSVVSDTDVDSCDSSLKKIESHIKAIGSLAICGFLGCILIVIGLALGSAMNIIIIWCI